MKKIMEELRLFLTSFLGEDRQNFVISNAKKNQSPNFYTVLIKKNYIQIAEKEGAFIKKMECTGEDIVFTLNGQISNDTDLPRRFQERLHRIVKDVLSKRADLLAG